MQIELIDGATGFSLVTPHYHQNGFSHVGIASTEVIFIATRGLPEVLGCVRFCFEENIPLLRSMLVDERFRRRGIARKLLLRFEEYIKSNQIRGAHLICSTRLNSFYGEVGFERIGFSDTPQLLLARIKARDPEFKKMNCLRRT